MLEKIKKIISKEEGSKKDKNSRALLRARNIYCVIQENRKGIFLTPILVSNDQSTFIDIETNDHYNFQPKVEKTGALPKLEKLPAKVQKTMEVEGKVIGLIPFCDLCEQICENNAKEDVPEFEIFKTCTDPKFILSEKDLFSVVDDLEKYVQTDEAKNAIAKK